MKAIQCFYLKWYKTTQQLKKKGYIVLFKEKWESFP